jgi:hypothetical protein
LIRNGCLNVTVSRRDLVKLTCLGLARTGAIPANRIAFARHSQLLLQIVCSRRSDSSLESGA